MNLAGNKFRKVNSTAHGIVQWRSHEYIYKFMIVLQLTISIRWRTIIRLTPGASQIDCSIASFPIRTESTTPQRPQPSQSITLPWNRTKRIVLSRAPLRNFHVGLVVVIFVLCRQPHQMAQLVFHSDTNLICARSASDMWPVHWRIIPSALASVPNHFTWISMWASPQPPLLAALEGD